MVGHRKNGFSLIEFTVALGLIGILLLASSQILVDTYKTKKQADILTLVNEFIFLNNQIATNKNLLSKYLGADSDNNIHRCLAGDTDINCASLSKPTATLPTPIDTNDLNGRMLGLNGFCNDFDGDPTCLVKNTFTYTMECSEKSCDKLTFFFEISYKNFTGQQAALAKKKTYSSMIALSQFRTLGQIKNPEASCKIITGLNFLDRTFECDKSIDPPNYLCEVKDGGVCATTYVSVPTESVFNATFGTTSKIVYSVSLAKKIYPEIDKYFDPNISKVKLCFSIEMDKYKEDYSAKSLQIRCPDKVLTNDITTISGLNISTGTKLFSSDASKVIFDEAALWKINGFDTVPTTSVSAPRVDNVCINFDLSNYLRKLNNVRTVKKWISWLEQEPPEMCLTPNPVINSENHECRIEIIKANGLTSTSKQVGFEISLPEISWLPCGERETPAIEVPPSRASFTPSLLPDPPSYAP